MKKVVLIVLVLIGLTGCSATANINIDKDKVTEKITVTGSSKSEYSEIKKFSPVTLYYDQELDDPYGNEKESNVLYYDISTNDSTKTAVASASFDLSQHTRSSMVRGCFKYYNIVDNNGNTVFSTSNGLICRFTNFDIVVSTPYLVVSNNATKVDTQNNIYTWKVNNSNKENISVYIEIDFSKKYNEKDDNTSSSSNTSTNSKKEVKQNKNVSSGLVFIAIVVIVAITIAIIIILRNKKNKLNNI